MESGMWQRFVAGMASGLAKVRQENKVPHLGRLENSHSSRAESGKARFRHLQEVVNTIAEVKEGGGRSK